MSDDQPIIRVSPEPTADELAAIVAAVSAALSAIEEAERPEPPPGRWTRAARNEALRTE